MSRAESSRGRLLVVATPIGNLGDVSQRLREALGEADIVLAEDTRRTGQLLSHLGIECPLQSFHRFNEARGLEAALERMRAGQTLALVSDAGTPTVSDPGTRLVAAAHEAGLRVEPIPGPSAAIAALSVSGLPGDTFYFAGFLPARRVGRRKEIEALARRAETLVLFEAPHRLVESLRDLSELLGAREAVLCRELTKHFEEILRRPLPELEADLAARAKIQGEIVLVIEGSGGTRAATQDPSPEWAGQWREALKAEEDDPRRALRKLSRELGVSRLDLRRSLEDAGLMPGEAGQD